MKNYKGDGVTIYLVDSGIDTTHSEFNSTNIINSYTYDGSFQDTDGHGTGVASVIAGRTLGIVPNVTLKNVKVAWGSIGTFGHMMEAWNTILQDTSNSVCIVNCSWTVPKHHIIDDKIKELDTKKFIVIATAGNELLPAKDFSPVNIDTVIGVAASDNTHTVRPWKETRGSNWGPEVNVTARGIDIEVATLGGGTAIASGTSLATATVSGIAAQFIQQYPEKNALEIKDLLLKYATPNILIRDEAIYNTTPNLLIQR